jgi:hypothetical protein
MPEKYYLRQNYPNPFNPSTTIRFSIPKAVMVSLKIYNLMGEEVITLIKEELPAGIHKVIWNAETYPSGVYFYRINTENFNSTHKMVLLK